MTFNRKSSNEVGQCKKAEFGGEPLTELSPITHSSELELRGHQQGIVPKKPVKYPQKGDI